MGVRSRQRWWGLTASLTVLSLLPACVENSGTSTTATTAITTTTTVAAAPPTQAPWTKKWIDLEVGDCLAAPPPTDPGVVTVAIVDCAASHSTEVFLRAPVAVDRAIADVANRECDAGFAQYTGQSVDGSPFTLAYLIDSNQNRTSSNPDPSTVICLLQAANGRPLTGSARH